MRRLLPVAVCIPLLFAAGSLLALRLGLYQKHVVLALFVAGFTGLSLAAAIRMAAVVRRADIERRAAEWAEADMALSERLLQAEQATGAALRESVRQTRELLEILSHAPVLARGLDGRIQFWSAGARAALRLDRAGGGRGRRAQAAAHRAAGAAGGGGGGPARARASGTRSWRGGPAAGGRVQVASHWILHRDHEGRPGAVIEVDNDVTEQKHAEEALRRGEARYRALVAAAAQIVWTASADGRRPIDTSQWEAFTGQTSSEATWGGWFEAIHPDDRAEAIRAWSEAVAGRQPAGGGAPAPPARRGVPQHGGAGRAGAGRPGPDPRVGRRPHRHHRPGPRRRAAEPGAAAPGGGHARRRRGARGATTSSWRCSASATSCSARWARATRRRPTCARWSARPPAPPGWPSSCSPSAGAR